MSACDSNTERLTYIEAKHGVPTYDSMEKAFASRLFDAAVICTPANTHLRVAHHCVKKNMHLLIEKPLATSLEGTYQIADEIERSGVYGAVAYVYHSIPCISKPREYLKGGSLGKPLQVTVQSGQHFPEFRPQYRSIYYNNRATGGGAIQDALTHHFNCVEWLISEPTTRVFCDSAHQALDGVDVEDTVSVTARNGDVLVSYALNQFQRPNETIIAVHCTDGSIKIELQNQRWMHLTKAMTDWQVHEEPLPGRDDIFVAQANAFLDGCEGRITNLCTIEQAIHTLKVNLAALNSSDTGTAVQVV